MHHSFRFYNRHREWFLRYYIFQAKWTRVPLIGGLVRAVANLYGRNVSGAYLLTPAEADEIIDMSSGLTVVPCTCRQVFHNCHRTIESEIMVSASRNIFSGERPKEYREITKEEARAILRQCEGEGSIHTIIKCRQDLYAICNCCACCCVPLRLSKKYGIGRALVRAKNIVERFRERQRAEPEVERSLSLPVEEKGR
ncbi:MAG: ferredoxin-like protein [Chloroflexi bacterium]|nr:ferredoxin-like protein [Chloroflexota bacterium]